MTKVTQTITSTNDDDLLLISRANGEVADMTIGDMRKQLLPVQTLHELSTNPWNIPLNWSTIPGLSHTVAIPSTVIVSAQVRVDGTTASNANASIAVFIDDVHQTDTTTIITHTGSKHESTTTLQALVRTDSLGQVISIRADSNGANDNPVVSDDDGGTNMRVITLN